MIADMSTCTTTSNDGISDRDCGHAARDRLARRRQLDHGGRPLEVGVSGAGSADPARTTSSLRMRPPGPVPSSPASEMPSETAVRLATGVARARVVASGLRRDRRAGGDERSRRFDGGLGTIDFHGRRRAVSVTEPRNRLAERGDSTLGHEDLSEQPVRLGLVDHGRLVRLDLDQRIAPEEALAGSLQPADDRSLAHRVRQARHPQDVLAHPLNSRVGRGSGNGASRPLRSMSTSCVRTSASI